MSAPDPAKWKATTEEVWEISEADHAPAVEIIERIARRRALEELKALFPETYTPHVDQHYGGPAPRLLDFEVVLNRIAAIEVEEATSPSASARTAALSPVP